MIWGVLSIKKTQSRSTAFLLAKKKDHLYQYNCSAIYHFFRGCNPLRPFSDILYLSFFVCRVKGISLLNLKEVSPNKVGYISKLSSVASSLKEVMKELKQWSMVKFGIVLKKIESLRNNLAKLQLAGADRAHIRTKMNQLDELLYREEMLWMQRSRVDWLKEGDRNMKFFHRKAVWRARKNRIKSLLDEHGGVHTDSKVMAEMTSSYFANLFTADPLLCADPVTNLINALVTDIMNEGLCAEFMDKEVSDALFQIGPLKAHGPDGFPTRIFQRNWAVMKVQVIAGVLEFFRT